MLNTKTAQRLAQGDAQKWILGLSGDAKDDILRFEALGAQHAARFGEQEILLFSTPGRTEIGGNHTDHQHGRVLAASVDLDVIAAVSRRDDGRAVLFSEGYEHAFEIDLAEVAPRAEEKETSAALIRGIAARCRELGYAIGGFSAVMSSRVLRGSGLSSSAAFEVLIADIFSALYNDGGIDAVTRARIGQYAENVYFGKPCGLMDQTACSVGGMVALDFSKEDPALRRLYVNFDALGYDVMVVDTRAGHDNLTAEYAAIPGEMREVAALFGKQLLREVDGGELIAALPSLRGKVSDRALLRALHFVDDDARVGAQVEALLAGDIERFFALIIESGESSWKLLQNIYVGGSVQQEMALALELSRRLLKGKGAWRVHGGGFAGTILAFVPHALRAAYIERMEAAFGAGCAATLRIRAVGAAHIE